MGVIPICRDISMVTDAMSTLGMAFIPMCRDISQVIKKLKNELSLLSLCVGIFLRRIS